MGAIEDGESVPASLIPIAQARRILGGISSQTLYRLAGDGRVTIIKIRRRSFVSSRDLASLAESGTARPKAECR
jgi:hypothetical protein